jgi:ankyrin repeat protein
VTVLHARFDIFLQESSSWVKSNHCIQLHPLGRIHRFCSARPIYSAKDEDDLTALHDASREGHVDVAGVLLERGADVSARDSRDRTPLYVASGGGHLGMVRLLLQRNTDIHARDKDGQTPFQRASAGGHQDVMQLLLEHGAVADPE